MTTLVGHFGDDRANAVAIQNDGKIVAAGYSYNGSNNDFALVRYNTDGSLDGMMIKATGGSDAQAYANAIQGDGKIVAGGTSWNGANYDFALVRYWP